MLTAKQFVDHLCWLPNDPERQVRETVAMVELAMLQEREACAKVADQPEFNELAKNNGWAVANAIRARS